MVVWGGATERRAQKSAQRKSAGGALLRGVRGADATTRAKKGRAPTEETPVVRGIGCIRRCRRASK